MAIPTTENPIASVIHISDLHFGEHIGNDESTLTRIQKGVPSLGGLLPHSYQACRALAIRINQILKDRKQASIIAGVIFTGDLTSSGEEQQFVVGNTYLRSAHSLGAGSYVGLDLRMEPVEVVDGFADPFLFAIPGNHDIWNRSDPRLLGVYRRTFPGSYPLSL